MTYKYSGKEKEFILEYRKTHSARETSERFNELFGRNSSRSSISAFCTKHGQNFGPNRYTKEEDEWLIRNVPEMSANDLVEEFNKRFPERTKPSLMKHYKCVLGLRCNQNVWLKQAADKQRYPVGTVKLYKIRGKKRSKNEKEIRDQLFIKLTDDWHWTRLCDYIWECNNGSIPDGHYVIHLDGNLLNNRIDNLELVSSTENAYMMRSGFYFDDPDLTKSGVAYSKLRAAIKERSKL